MKSKAILAFCLTAATILASGAIQAQTARKFDLQDASTRLLAGTPSASVPASPDAPSQVFIYQERIRGLRANPIFVDGIQVASLRKRWSYFVMQLRAGEHAFYGRHKDQELVLDLKPGEVCYLRLDQVMTYPGYEKLVRTSIAEGQLAASSRKLEPIEPSDVLDHFRVIFSVRAVE
jgi:hypothetical protein